MLSARARVSVNHDAVASWHWQQARADMHAGPNQLARDGRLAASVRFDTYYMYASYLHLSYQLLPACPCLFNL